jgi:hypothetical protein
MHEFHPATRLSEVAAAVDLQPLESGDPRYVDMAAGRETDQLQRLRLCLEDYDARRNRFAKIGFTGHRGSGKSTELLRLEHEYDDRFTSLHHFAEDALLGDFDYTDLFLWLTDELIRRFEDWGMPLDAGLANDVANWFATTTQVNVEEVRKELEVEAQAEAKSRVGVFGLSLGLFARLKSMIVGSSQRRSEIRRELRKYSSELIRRFDLLLDSSCSVLSANGKPANLLIVVDNLDRLATEVAATLFFKDA